MASSTDNQTPQADQKCPHDGAYPPELLERLHHDCPADMSFWCGSKILEEARTLETECQVDGGDYYLRLHKKFREYVEDAINGCFRIDDDAPYVQVFWATQEKPEPDERPTPRDGRRPPGSRLLNQTIIDLNTRYHAHYLLEGLTQFGIGRSHIFTITPPQPDSPNRAQLICHPMAPAAAGYTKTATWQNEINFDGRPTVAELWHELCNRASNDEPQSQLAEKITGQIQRWAQEATWPEDHFRAHLTNDTERRLADKIEREAKVERKANTRPRKILSFPERYIEAVKHIALISLYQENNDFAAMTYILAPTLSGACAASLVVYWPRREDHKWEAVGSSHLLYLLQMILGQNATTILAKDREGRQATRLAEARKVALSHYGHTLKHRLDVLSAFLNANATGAVRLRADMLKDLTLILQLNSVDDRQELCEKLPEPKRKRFLDIDGVDDAPGELDLLGRVHVWADVLTRDEDVPVKDANGRVEKHVHCPVGLKLYDRIASATVGWQMTSMGQGARLKEPVFRELLFELLNNAWQYGDRRLRTIDGKAQVQISVWLDTVRMIIDGKTRPLLVLANVIQPAKVDDCPMIAQSWTRWPDKGDIRYNGPGMALDLFRRLDLGDMYYRTRTHKGTLYLEVGISFGAALSVNAGVAKEQANE